MKQLLTISFLLICFSVFGQNSGTFKVAKQDSDLIKPKRFFVGVENTLAGKSSPTAFRSYALRFGTRFFLSENKYPIYFGGNVGKSNPTDKYKGFAVGLLAGTDMINLLVGPGSINFPLEFNYKKLFNEFDAENLNQYQLTAGIRIPLYFLTFGRMNVSGLELTFLAKYSYEVNSTDSYKGFYPTLRIDYYF